MPQLIDGQSISDFRSDTVTRPCPVMRQAMAEAVVGDDVFGDDPTVQELERRAADLFGKQAGLFVPTGTMANLVAATVHTQPGQEVFVESLSHAYNNEVGGLARFAGVVTRTLVGDRGAIDPDEVARYARPGDLHQPRTGLLMVENTHNFWGGRVIPLEHVARLREVCQAKDVRLHLDGARIFNACTASGTEPRQWGELCDSIYFCLSKGLGAPIGSVLMGSQAFVDEARLVRKVLGGGMRQVGVLAAAGLVALEQGPGRLHEDHAHAKQLAEGLVAIPGAVVDPASCDTNILFVRTQAGAPSYGPIAEGLKRSGVWAIPLGDLGIRFVTHRDVNGEDVERALSALRELIPTHGQAA
jgi:threonine aldolase